MAPPPNPAGQAPTPEAAEINNGVLLKNFEDKFTRATRARDLCSGYGRSQVSLFRDKYDLVLRLRAEVTTLLHYVHANNAVLPAPAQLDISSKVEAFDDIVEAVTVFYYTASDSASVKQRVDTEPPAVASPPRAGIKLPNIQVPQFNNNIKDFPRFLNLFEAVYGNNPALSPADKFYYLQSLLTGESLILVSRYPLTEIGYNEAFDALKARFQCPRTLISSYVSELLSFTAAKRACPETLKAYLEVHNDNVLALKAIPEVKDLSDILLLHIALRNLDSYTRRQFESQFNTKDDAIPTYKDLMSFVLKSQQSASIIEAEKPSSIEYAPKPKFNAKAFYVNSGKPQDLPPRSQQFNAKNNNCAYCNSTQHKIYKCATFSSLPLQARIDWVKSNKRCLACFSSTHLLISCKSTKQCINCSGKNHNSVICPNKGQTPKKTSDGHQTPKEEAPCTQDTKPSSSSVLSCTNQANSKKFITMFGTVVCNVYDRSGFVHEITAVLDGGSHKNLITAEAAAKLGLYVSPSKDNSINGINNSSVPLSGESCITIHSRTEDSHVTLSASVLPEITADLHPVNVHPEYLRRLSQLNLADPKPFSSKKIELLLNAGVTFDLLFPRHHTLPKVDLGSDFPNPVPTSFGYVIMGDIPAPPTNLLAISEENPIASASESPSVLLTIGESSLSRQMEQLFERESIPEPADELNSPEPMQELEEHFLKTHKRDVNGKFIVSLPFIKNPPNIGNNRAKIFASFHSTETRLIKSESNYAVYQTALQDYVNKGEITPSTKTNDFLFNNHIVFKRSSNKPKLVFDPTLKASNCDSHFNDQLSCGPPLQRHINYIILAARWHRVCFTADIDTFYRSIKVSDEDAEKMHILARVDELGNISQSGQVSELKIAHLCYGLKSSPFLALRCLKQLSMEHQSDMPEAAAALQYSTYIDDVWAGCSSVPECIKLRTQLTTILSKGGFRLAKFSASHPEILNDLTDLDLAGRVHISNPQADLIPVLGLFWNPSKDVFRFDISDFTGPVTRRNCSSLLAKTYDSLGLIHPVIFWLKQFVQNLWLEHPDLGWDSPLPTPLSQAWHGFVSELPLLRELNIPRFISNPEGENWLILFADASEKGYACSAYLLSKFKNEYKCNLLTAKSKLAPLKTKRTIPQLELAAIQLASTLINWFFSGNLPYRIVSTHIFSDSTISLAYLKIPVYKLKVYTANRVSKITQLTEKYKVSFHHCRSHENSADPASRGLYPSQLLGNNLWFHGPKFLMNGPPSCDEDPASFQSSDLHLPDMKPQSTLLTTSRTISAKMEENAIFILTNNCSEYQKLRRITAYVLRFVSNLRCKKLNEEKKTSTLTITELNKATTILCKISQQLIQKSHTELSPFQDDSGVLRVGGRLQNSNLDYSGKHPILLPKKCSLSTLICRHFHHIAGHGGLSLSLSLTRHQFWIISGRSLMNSVIRKCVTCAKWNPKFPAPQQGNLPIFRTEMCFPFRNVVGIDAFGPYNVKLSARRNSGTQKIWGLLFVCEATRAVHIEPISSMDTKAFLAAFDRFSSRRGLPSVVRTDNAGAFVAGGKILSEYAAFLEREKNNIISAFLARNIKFSLIPVYSPWFGSWEPLIKQFKKFLKPLLTQTFYFEEYVTIFARVEGLMNSRPYLPPSSDVQNTCDLLCPGSFLVGGPLVTAPEIPTTSKNLTIGNRWDRIKTIIQSFWKMFKEETLRNLQSKLKWPKDNPSLQVGHLVWIKNTASPPSSWPLGIVQSIIPGSDGIVRVVDVKTNSGTIRRSSRNLVLVPVEN